MATKSGAWYDMLPLFLLFFGGFFFQNSCVHFVTLIRGLFYISFVALLLSILLSGQAYSPDGRNLASVAQDGAVHVLEVEA